MPAIGATLVLGLLIFACPNPPTTTAASLPKDAIAAGVVLGDSVNVRAGPGTAYEVVLQLSGGAPVSIVGEAFGWLLVRPETEVKVFVSRDLVEPKGDGIAVVTHDRVNLRSRPVADATVLGQASRGDLVRLIDSAGDFVTIAAPPEVCLYVHKDLVRRVDATVAAATVPAAAPAEPPPPPPGPTAGEKAIRGRELYQAELERADLDVMQFGEAKRLFEEALREAKSDDVRALAQAGLRRVKVAIQLQEDYRRRVKPIERMVSGDSEPCTPETPRRK